MIRSFTFFTALFLLFACVADVHPAKKAPTSSEVKKELKNLLDKHNSKDVEAYSRRPAVPKMFSIPPVIIRVILYIILIALFIGLITGIFYIIKTGNAVPGNKKAVEKDEIAGDEVLRGDMPPFEELYRKAVALARDGNYNKAVILLHRATIEFLSDALIIQRNREYTNNDLKRAVKKQDALFNPFCSITKYAEIAAFSGSRVSGDDFSEAHRSFENSFLK